MLRGQLVDIILGAFFLFMGLAACGIAAIRHRSGARVLIWFGMWSAMYGAVELTESPAIVAVSPHWFQISLPYLDISIQYFIVVVAWLAFLELSRGKLRLLIWALISLGLATAVAAITCFLFTGSADRLMPYNHALAAFSLIVLLTVVAVPKLYSKFLDLPNRGVLTVGMLLFGMEALYVNVTHPLGYQTPRVLDHLAFTVCLLSFGYVAVQITFANERRLLLIERELEVARQLQFSILPTTIPEIRDVRIAVAYRPMTAVAGDFYEFIPVDAKQVGFLVADVTGHGVPAALIASMIKVAMQSVVPCAHDPREVLLGLNRLLFKQLREQFVSAAYLWLDTENRKASYSAAGHPPLLRWREGKLERIESNGLLFGVVPDPDYPVCGLSIHSGDRFLLYTDGVIEPENAHGDSFGDKKLEEVVRKNQSCPPSELSDQLLSEIGLWRAASLAQQDDITLIVIDVV
jgi:sigma-B regulation protein RsbU (phosphoserine phosphatase)